MGMMKDGMLFAFALIGGGKKICGTVIWVDDWTSSEEVNDGTWRENSKQSFVAFSSISQKKHDDEDAFIMELLSLE
jgi:hypothetical protein